MLATNREIKIHSAVRIKAETVNLPGWWDVAQLPSGSGAVYNREAPRR